MPKFNNVYCTLCAIIYIQLLGYSYQRLVSVDQQEEKFNEMLMKVNEIEEKLKTLTENGDEGILK